MPFTVSLKEHLEMPELRNVLLWPSLLRVECFVAVESALETHMTTAEALNVPVSLVACNFLCVLNRCSGASYFFDNYIFS